MRFEEYTREHPLIYEGAEIASVIDLLCRCYAEENILETEQAKACWQRIGRLLEPLLLEEMIT